MIEDRSRARGRGDSAGAERESREAWEDEGGSVDERVPRTARPKRKTSRGRDAGQS